MAVGFKKKVEITEEGYTGLRIHIMLNLFKVLIITSIFSTFLSGCASNIPTAHVTIQAANYLNPDVNGRASPIVITIYELSSSLTFKNAGYYCLAQNADAALKSTLIDKHTIEAQPAQIISLVEKLSPNTKYIGITAAYRNISQKRWKEIIKLPPKDKKLYIHVIVQSSGLVATLEN